MLVVAVIPHVGIDEAFFESLSVTDKRKVDNDLKFVVAVTIAERFVLQVVVKPQAIHLKLLSLQLQTEVMIDAKTRKSFFFRNICCNRFTTDRWRTVA